MKAGSNSLSAGLSNVMYSSGGHIIINKEKGKVDTRKSKPEHLHVLDENFWQLNLTVMNDPDYMFFLSPKDAF